jgi:hypothetical protein
MKKAILIIFMVITGSAYSAKYAGEPFSLGVGGRALGMGGAAVAGPFDGSAAYWNPAGLNYLPGRNIMAMHAETFGSLLNHDFVAFSSNGGDSTSSIRAFGFYFYYLGGGGIKLTGWDAVRNRPYVIAEASHGDYLLAGAISGKIKNRIDFGISARVIYRDVGGAVKGYGLTADIGLLYEIHKKIMIGLAITDLTSGYIRYSGGYSESILPTVKPGILVSQAVHDFTGRLTISGDIKFEGRRGASQFWFKDLSLDTHWGLEISYKEMLFGRAGFDIGNLTAGLGIDVRRITIDLAYLHNDFLDETFRVSAGYRF